MQIETDRAEVVSGVRLGETIGSPIAMVVWNRDWENWTLAMSPLPPEPDANPRALRPHYLPRPGHADLVGVLKYDRRDTREPADPGGLGDGARVLARETRLALWREHLGRKPGDDADLVDAVAAIPLLRQAASDLDAWNEDGRTGPRPPGRLRHHKPGPVRWWATWWSHPLHRLLVDPDGRPRSLRRAGSF